MPNRSSILPADSPRCLGHNCYRRDDCARFLDRDTARQGKPIAATLNRIQEPRCFYFVPGEPEPAATA